MSNLASAVAEEELNNFFTSQVARDLKPRSRSRSRPAPDEKKPNNFDLEIKIQSSQPIDLDILNLNLPKQNLTFNVINL